MRELAELKAKEAERKAQEEARRKREELERKLKEASANFVSADCVVVGDMTFRPSLAHLGAKPRSWTPPIGISSRRSRSQVERGRRRTARSVRTRGWACSGG